MTTAPPPGWYPDPEAADRQWRWWDGARWAPPGYGYAPAFDPVAHAQELARRAETTRSIGRWFRAAMVAFVAATLLAGVGTGLVLNELFDAVGDPFSGGVIAFQLLTFPFSLVSWAYLGLFIAWLYHAGKFADLQPWPAVRSRTLGAFSPLIPFLNLWWPYEAIRDCFPPGTRPRVTVWWFVGQLVLPATMVWLVAISVVAAPPVVTAFVVVFAGALLAVIPVLGGQLVARLDEVQRAHLTS